MENEDGGDPERSAAGEVSLDGIEIMMRLAAAMDAEGSAWEVTICEPGHTLSGWYIPDDVLRESAGLFENVDVNLYELSAKGATHVPDVLFGLKNLLAKNKVGWIDGVKYVAGRGLAGVLHFLDSAKWLGKNLLAGMKDGKAVYGLSYDCPVRAKKDIVDEKSVMKITKFLKADSVDIVTRPAAGGRFDRAVAALTREEIMDKKKLWEMISKARPALLTGKEFDKVTDDEVVELARMAMEPAAPAAPAVPAPPAPGSVSKEEFDLLRCEMALKDKLSGSDLPEIAQGRIRAAFAKRVFTAEDLDAAIAGEKDYLAKMSQYYQAQQAEPIPGSGIRVGLGSIQRAQMAVDRMFGLSAVDLKQLNGLRRLDNQPFFADLRSVQDLEHFNEVPIFSGLREMYVHFTGDHEITGRFNRKNLPPELRASADINSQTFSFILGNTLGRRLVKTYLAVDYGEALFISIRKPVRDFRTQEAVMVGYFPDIDTVDPEAADYDEINAVTDEEATYALIQKGNILTITRKTIINDDVSVIPRVVDRFGRAFRRTHAKYVIGFWINNSNCSDGTAWHTVGHGNLVAVAMSVTNVLAAYKALGKMTEKDSGERIGLLDDPNVKPVLIHPIDLFDTADIIANNEFYPGAIAAAAQNDRNPMRNKITTRSISLLTDTTDWGLILPPDAVDHVEMGYLNGRQEPEMFLADNPQSEQVFVADKIRYKGRHEYAGTPVDYRGSVKSENP